MKKLVTILSLLLLCACHEAGEVRQPTIKNIAIKGKVYSIHQVYIWNSSHPITILVPEDSTTVPISINQTQQSGKVTYNSSTIIIQ